MPGRFFFDLVNGQDVIRDDEGVEADSLETAVSAAATEVQEMRRSGGLGDPESGWMLVIRDAQDNELRRISI